MSSPPRRLLPDAPTPPLPALAGVRGLACVPVLLFHVASATPFTTRSGLFQVAFAHAAVSSVMVFLWLSGYLIMLPIFSSHARGRAPAPPLRFLAQRGLRIYPMYWFVLVTGVFVIGLDRFDAGEWALVLSLAYVAVGSMFYRGLVVSWTLAADVVFYLVVAAVLPVLARLAPAGTDRSRVRWAQRIVLAMLMGSATAGTVAVVVADLAFGWEPGLLAGPAVIGMVIFTGAICAYVVDADIVPPTARMLARTPWAAVLAAGAAFAVVCAFPLPPGLVGKPDGLTLIGSLIAMAVFATLVCLPAAADPGGASLFHRFLGSNVLRWLGELSFAIYLWQIPVLHVVESQVEITVANLWWTIPVTALGTFVVAVPTYLVVETPLRDAVRRRLGARAALARAPAPTLP